MNANDAGAKAEDLVRGEVATQNGMWGDFNERADISKGQLLQAAVAQASAVKIAAELPYLKRSVAFESAKNQYYPKDWSGFRDYGSDVMNLVVAAAYLQNEIKRRLMNDESFERSKRRPDQPYNPATGLPNKAA